MDLTLKSNRILSATANKLILSITDDYTTSDVPWTSISHIIAASIKGKKPPYMLLFFIRDYSEIFVIDASIFNFKSFLSKTIIKQNQKFLQLIKSFVESSKKAFIDWPLRDAIKSDSLSFLPEFKNMGSLMSYCASIKTKENFEENQKTNEISDDSKIMMFHKKLEYFRNRREMAKIKLIKAKDIYAQAQEGEEYEYTLISVLKETDGALSIDPNFIDAYLFKSNISRDLDRKRNALEALLSITARIPENMLNDVLSTDIYIHLADLYYELNEPAKEMEMFQNYCGISPSKDANHAIVKALSDYLQMDNSDWYNLAIEGYNYYLDGNPFKASNIFLELLSKVNFRWGYHWLALCFKALGNIPQAIDLLNAANSQYPSYSTYMELGFLLEENGEPIKAQNIFRQAFEFMPKCPYAYMSSAQSLIKSSTDDITAFNLILEAIDCDPYGPFISHAEELVKQIQKASSATGKNLEERRTKKVGDSFEDGYKIQDIFKGGMGIVYKVLEEETGKIYAIKTFQDKFIWNAEVVKMFYHEAEIWIRLGIHQNIVQAIKVKDFDGKPYMFLEFIEGTDLEAILKYRQLNAEEIIDYALQFCSGMGYAYKTLGVIHQDIKPSNCMITNDGILKITDFGLVKIFSETMDSSQADSELEQIKAQRKTMMELLPSDIKNAKPSSLLDANAIDIDMAGVTSSFMDTDTMDGNNSKVGGTIPYMAPELFTGEGTVSALTDIYSFGAMLYEMIDGEPPFGAEDFESCIMGHIEKIPDNPSLKRKDIPEELSAIALKCLEKNPEDRYGDFSEIFADLTSLSAKLGIESYSFGNSNAEEYDTLERMIYRGEALMVLEKYAEAAEVFTKTLKVYPMATKVLTERAECYRVMGKYKESLHDLKTSLKSDKTNAKAHYYMGLLCLSIKQFKEAHAYFQTSAKLNPDNADVWLKLGSMYDLIGDPKTALKYYDNALKINSRFTVAWNNKGNIFMKEGKYFDALACYTKSIESNPRYQLAWLNQGIVKQQLHLHFDAISSFKKSIEINPKSTKAMVCILDSLTKIKAYDEAFKYFELLEELEQSNFYILFLKAVCYYEKGMFKEALKFIKQALEQDKNSKQAAKFLLFVYLKLYKYAEGKQAYEKLSSVCREDSDIKLIYDTMCERLNALSFMKDYSIWFSEPELRDNIHFSITEFELNFSKYENKLKEYDENSILKNRLYLLNQIMSKDVQNSNSKYPCVKFVDFNEPILTEEQKIYEELKKLLRKNNGKPLLIQSHSNNESAYDKALEAMYKTKDYTKALQLFQKIIPKVWGEIELWNHVAVCMFELGDNIGALNILSQGIARTPLELKFWLLKGFLEKKLRLKKQSVDTFAFILSIFPASTEALFAIISINTENGLTRKAGYIAGIFSSLFDRLSLENPTNLFALSFIYLASGRLDEAKDAIDSFLSFYPSSIDATFLYIYLDLAKHNYDSALNRLLAIQPKDTENNLYAERLMNLIEGYILMNQEKFDLADLAFNKIPSTFEEYPFAIYYKIISMSKTEDHGLAVKTIISNLISEHPNEDLLWEAQGYILSKDKNTYTNALWSFSKSIELNPESIYAYINSGIVLHKIGRYEDSLEFFDKAISKEADNEDAITLKAVSFFLLDKCDEALEWITKAQAINAFNSFPYLLTAVILFKRGKYNEASERIDQAFAIDPNNPELWNLKGLLMRASNKINDEIFSYNRAIELEPTCVSACVNKGIWLMETKRYQEAKAIFDIVLEKSPNYAVAWRESGECQYKLQKYNDALRRYNLSIQTTPLDYEAHNGKAETLMALDKSSEALWAMQRSVELNDKQANIWNNIGVVLARSGVYEQAYQSLIKASEQEDIYDVIIYNLLLMSMEINHIENIKLFSERFYEIETSLELPQPGKSQLLLAPFRQPTAPFATTDFSSYFDLKVKPMPLFFIKTGEYLTTRKNFCYNYLET